MGKTSRISINNLDEIAKKYDNEVVVDWNGFELHIKTLLSLDEMLAFVGSVARSCFDGDTGEYLPEVLEFAIRNNIVDRYSNVALPENLEHQYRLLYQTDIVDTIFEHIDRRQFDDMSTALSQKIKHLAEANVQMLAGRVNDTINAMNQFVDGFKGIFDSVDANDIQKIVDAISQGRVDEEKLMSAYMERRTHDAEPAQEEQGEIGEPEFKVIPFPQQEDTSTDTPGGEE